MKAMMLIGLIFSLSWGSVALCCFKPKPEQTSSVAELVKRTHGIYLAEATGREADGGFQFNVIKILKGKKKATLQVPSNLLNDEKLCAEIFGEVIFLDSYLSEVPYNFKSGCQCYLQH